jgi:putative ABC transport system permease protein
MSHSVYRALLRLYPSSFRADYESELLRAFEDSTRGQGSIASGIAAVIDVVPNALAAHATILRQDLRYAVRTMGRSRGFVATVVLVTALGVGANTATFSVADFVLLRPLPFPDSRSIVRLCEGPKEGGGWGCMNELSPANFRDATAMTKYTRGWGAFTSGDVNLVGFGEPVRVGGIRVGPQVFPLLGIRPLLGRTIDRAEEGTVVIGYGLWQSQFGGDPAIIGKTIRLDDVPRTVIGVMPQGFHFPDRGAQLWSPLVLPDVEYEDRTNTYLQAVGRIAPGATFEQGRAELSLIFDRLGRDFPATNAETGFSFFAQRDQMLPRNRTILLALCGASLCLLLLTGANLANLLLVRAAARERELAVRSALGAGRDRLMRQMLTEGLLLAFLGGLAGVVVAALAVPLLAYLVPSSLPLDAQPTLDGRALAIALAFTALVGIGFGLIPATALGQRGGFMALREGGRSNGGGRQRLRAALVSIEVAVSVVLLVSSAFLVRALWKVQAIDPGFSSEGVLLVRTPLTPNRASDSVRRQQFYDEVLRGVKGLPGVQSAAYTSGVPMVLTGGVTAIMITGAERPTDVQRDPVSFRYVTPEFFATLRIPIRRGRAFEESDRLGRPLVAVVSESFADRYWPGAEPIGKTFSTRGMTYSIVGVVPDIKVRGPERTSEPQLYVAAAQGGSQIGGLQIPKDLVIRAGPGALSLVPSVRDVIHRADADQPVANVSMLKDVITRMTADRRAQLRVLGALAGVALILTAIGIHGLLAFMVAQRSREIGVRLALGAEPGRVARMIVSEAGRLALIGGIPGLFGAYAAVRATQSLLFGIPPSDPMTVAAGVLVVMSVTLLGSLAPALRAVRVSPLEAIRSD